MTLVTAAGTVAARIVKPDIRTFITGATGAIAMTTTFVIAGTTTETMIVIAAGGTIGR
jgi:hypothetical protein